MNSVVSTFSHDASSPYGADCQEQILSQDSSYFLLDPLSRHCSPEGYMHASSPYMFSMSNYSGATPRSTGQIDAPESTSPYDAGNTSDWKYDSPVENTSPRRTSNEMQNETYNSGRDYPVCCLYAGCNVKPFKRRADLDRHYKNCHAPESQKESYKCDYPKCVRRLEPFHRRDHFRDHLRDFHKEDIEKRGGVVTEEWFDNRYLPASWWRCPKCLVRIHIKQHGYECPTCKTPCQVKRKEARKRES